MGARGKLNIDHFGGSLLLAGLAGLALQSWAAFIALFVVLVVFGCIAGNIR